MTSVLATLSRAGAASKADPTCSSTVSEYRSFLPGRTRDGIVSSQRNACSGDCQLQFACLALMPGPVIVRISASLFPRARDTLLLTAPPLAPASRNQTAKRCADRAMVPPDRGELKRSKPYAT